MANIRAFGDASEYHLNITAADGVHHAYVPLVVELLPANKVTGSGHVVEAVGRIAVCGQ